MKTILIVDANQLARDYVKSVLPGQATQEESSPINALMALERDPDIKGAIVDLQIGGGLTSGVRFVREAKARRPYVPIIVLTGFALEDVDRTLIARCMDDGAFAIIPKPGGQVTVDQFTAQLQAAVSFALGSQYVG